MSTPRVAASLAILLSTVAGCGGRPIITGAAQTNVTNSGAAGTGAAGTGAAGTGVVGKCGAVPADETVAPGCGATCGTPAGEVQAIPTIDAAYTIMEGRWQSCDDTWQKSAGAPADTIGVEWGAASREMTSRGSTVGGKMYYLVQGALGPERGHGFAYQLDYDISPEGPTSYQINVHPAPNSGFDLRIRYSPCPNELEVWVGESQQATTMVRFGACEGTTGAAGSGAAGTGGSQLCSAPTADETPVAPACAATCGTPAGEIQPITSVDAAYAVMQGRWQFCDDTWKKNVAVPADAVGIEWGVASRAPTANGSTVGGKMYFLVAGPDGPERGRGFAYQLDYDIASEGGDSYQINIHPAPNSGYWIRIRYSPCPDELEVRVFYAAEPTTMVRFAKCDGGAPPPAVDAGADKSPGPSDGGACVYPAGSLHYQSPGCGAAAPTPICGYVGMLGCFSGFICNCDGTVTGVCEHWSEKPWAYFIPYNVNVDGGAGYAACDPNRLPQ